MVDIQMKDVEVSQNFAKRLVQKLPLTMVLSYLAYLDDIEQLLNLLSRGSRVFFMKNEGAIKHFVLYKPIAQMTIVFSDTLVQFIRPITHTFVSLLAFVGIGTHLHKIENFLSNSLGFESISVGNRDFKLFEKADPHDICGAAINSAEVSEIDTANFRTLRTMLKKTRAI